MEIEGGGRWVEIDRLRQVGGDRRWRQKGGGRQVEIKGGGR